MTTARLCAGIDPVGSGPPGSGLSKALALHDEALAKSAHAPSVLKPNLAFFLAHGSPGLSLLEDFVRRHRQAGREIILDCKCNEIANSLEAWLHFAFRSLGVTGITVNPFLGEKTLEMACAMAAEHGGSLGRVYALCATSEFSKGTLAYLQERPERIIEACVAAREKVAGRTLPRLAGVVVGANREDVLFSQALRDSGLSVLAPGLGAQGADWETVAKCGCLENEVTFPVSRGIFQGGNSTLEQALAALREVAAHF